MEINGKWWSSEVEQDEGDRRETNRSLTDARGAQPRVDRESSETSTGLRTIREHPVVPKVVERQRKSQSTTIEPYRSLSRAPLSNARFSDDSTLNSIAEGKSKLSRGSSGAAVKTLQTALTDLGYSLPKFGSDGKFGRETAGALSAFQSDRHLHASGVLDAATLRELDAHAPPPNEAATLYPEYAQMFRDGVLNVTVGMGYDEDNSDLWQREKLLSGLTSRGFRPLDSLGDGELRELGVDRAKLDPTARYFVKPFEAEGKRVTALVRYVDRSSVDPKSQFAAGMQSSEVVLYGGHARYGSGPDFDPIDSTAGNFVLGVNAKGHRDGTLTKAYDEHMRGLLGNAPNDLERAKLTNDYQFMLFAGCRTKDYFDELRGIPKNKDRRNLDVMGSEDLLSWANTSENLLTALDDLMAQKSVNALQSDLKRINGVGFAADGFGGNAQPV